MGEKPFVYMVRRVGVNIARYHRVSTDDQNPQRQLDATEEYADREWGETGTVYVDRSTGTNTDREQYKDLMEAVESGEIDAVVVHEVSRVSRSIRDLDRTVERLRENDAELHIISEGLTMKPDDADPYQTALLQLLGVFAELEASMTRKRVKEGIAARMDNEEYHHGRAPLGFEKDDGQLVEGDDYHNVAAVLEMVEKDELSKRKAADELDSSRRTINRALGRMELYG